jgi:proline dehydrogenase
MFEQLIASGLPYAPRGLVGRVARRYIAGETVDDALTCVRALHEEGIAATVALLGEDIADDVEADATVDAYAGLIDALAADGLGANVSIKLSSLGLDLSEARCRARLATVVERAAGHAMFVRIDMESSRTTDVTLAIWGDLHAAGQEHVGVVLQSMLRRTVADARALAAQSAPVRVCKGIYREPPAIAYQDPEAVRASYLEAVRVLIAGGSRVALATHDERLVEAAWKIADAEGSADQVEHQMLLGVREPLRAELRAAGRPVRVYVPYGARWYEYSLRRLQENPRVAGYVARAVIERPWRSTTRS